MIALFNRFQIEMTMREALSMSSPGQDADPIVGMYVKQARFQRQFTKIGQGNIQLELKECGAWDEEELADHAENQKRILWIAACNIREENNQRAK